MAFAQESSLLTGVHTLLGHKDVVLCCICWDGKSPYPPAQPFPTDTKPQGWAHTGAGQGHAEVPGALRTADK